MIFIGFVFCWFIPGFFLFTALFPGRNDIHNLRRAGLSIGFSIGLVVVNGLVLSKGNIFCGKYLWLLLVSETIFFAFIGYFRGFKIKVPSFKKLHCVITGEKTDRKDILVAAGITFVLGCNGFFILKYPHMISDFSTWRYAADAKNIVEMHGFPQYSIQWNMKLPPVINKISFNIFTATLFAITGFDRALVLKLFCSTVFAVTVLNCWLFLRNFFSKGIAATTIITMFLYISFFPYKFKTYKAEAFGIMLLFLILWVVYESLFKKSRGFLFLIPVFFVLTATSHGVPAVVAALFILALYISKWIVELQFEGMEAIHVVIIFVLSIIGVFVIFQVPSNSSLGFKGSITKSEKYLPYKGFDPTYEFLSIVADEEGRGTKHRYIQKGAFYAPPALLLKQIVSKNVSDNVPDRVWRRIKHVSDKQRLLFFILMVSATVYLFVKINTAQKILLLSSMLFFGAVFLLSVLFSLTYNTYFPAMHGVMREARYIVLLPLFFTAAGGQYFYRVINKYFSSRNYGERSLYIGAVIAVCCFIVFPSVKRLNKLHKQPGVRMSKEGYETLQWLKNNTPEDALILANVRTGGSLDFFSDRIGLLEGGGPFLRPLILDKVLHILDDARDFFTDPGRGNILKKYNVNYVVTVPETDMGGWNILTQGISEEMDLLPYLKEVKTFGMIKIYEVDKNASGS